MKISGETSCRSIIKAAKNKKTSIIVCKNFKKVNNSDI